MKYNIAKSTSFIKGFKIKTILLAVFAVFSQTILTAAFIEKNGLAVMEVESAPLTGPWESSKSISGYSGSEYYLCTADSFKVGGKGILSYPFTVNNAGEYQVQLRNRIAEGNSNTEANDTFVRLIDASGNTIKPVANGNTVTGTWYKCYQNTKNTWTWQTSNKDHDPRALSWSLNAGKTYTLQLSGRSKGHAVDKIVLWNKSLHNFSTGKGKVNNSALDKLALSEANSSGGGNSTGNENNDANTNTRFNRAKDILIAQFDNKEDADDLHSQAALGCILTHPDGAGIKFYAVMGAYGIQNGTFVDSTSLFNLAFGAKNSKWTDAHNDRAGSINRIRNRVKAVLDAGGKAWVQEAGQSDLTADWIRALKSVGVSNTVIKNNVIVVQHSEWNERHTTPADLTYVKNNATYRAIDDGNYNSGTKVNRGPDTPNYKSSKTATQFLINAKNANNPNTYARNVWREADKIVKDINFNPKWSPISSGGVDFSDCVENWWIFGLGNKADTINKFFERYVTNTPDDVEEPEPNIKPSVSFNSPTNGQSYDAPATINLVEVAAADSDGSVANVKLYLNNTLVSQRNTSPYRWSQSNTPKLRNLAVGTYKLRALATDNEGATASKTITINVKTVSDLLPVGQTLANVGKTGSDSLVAYSDGTYLISASGLDIWGKEDAFGFVHQDVTGNIDITAKIQSLEKTHVWAKAGVMIRESLDAGSKYAMTLVSSDLGASFHRRTKTDANSSRTIFPGIKAPTFVRILRIGNKFTGYYGSNNQVWYPMDTVKLAMTRDIKVGLAVTSRNENEETEALISNYSVKKPGAKFQVLRFILVNAITNEDIREIHHNETINLAEDGKNLNIRVENRGSGGSIVFELNGKKVTENMAPYTMSGDMSGDYNIWSPKVGSYSIMATPYPEKDAKGNAGASIAIIVDVVNN